MARLTTASPSRCRWPAPTPKPALPEAGLTVALGTGVGTGLARLAIGLGLEHVEHPVGDDEAAHDVQGGEDDGEEAQGELGGTVRLAQDEHGADEDDAVDGVAARHERGVQDARHLGDDLVAHEGGQDEHRDEGHEAGIGGDHGASSPWVRPATRRWARGRPRRPAPRSCRPRSRRRSRAATRRPPR